ncbi:MAG: hypothetical protein LBD02_07270 [Christensenellaceae bacterium]|jgi:hypothetical protein|nr:hypothetical protein [Christensenellaceae bacterium]
MSDELGRILQAHFSGREGPPEALRAALRQGLLAVERRQKRRAAWLVLSYSAALSAALGLLLWLLLGQSVLAGAVNALSAFALLGGVAIALACQRAEEKGGSQNGTR